ncbi:RagB/SusD family nutrient uptake outer membrane protein [Mucilaginibacter sp. L196]|uniref:RagB/SusD family nutrient uptake outer membrane protein n=1 Tax=Mucilaginibacter sp. L196 TaxID=1641870 RepID=UPI00131B9A1F|nr:RagB/SusD family nutrient uptake outer membrane protein [Mucilaginibacter sp. L196]
MKIKKQFKKYPLFFISVVMLLVAPSCKKTVEVGNPVTQVSSADVFASDPAITAAISGIYSDMLNSYAGGGYYSVSAVVSYSADELLSSDYSFYDDNILPNDYELPYLWGSPYTDIYAANNLLEGLAKPNGISAAMNKQITGEAKFIRAFDYFYLVNLFGDVPLVTGTAWQQNTNATRTPSVQVYQQIVADLKDAQASLPADYSASKGERVRPNKWAATALLARVYLYMEDWPDAEIQASAVIANSSLYSLVSLNQVFLKNSNEAIWQLSSDNSNAQDAEVFSPEPDPSFSSPLQQSTVDKFSADDQRLTYWITPLDDGTGTGNLLYFPTKYKNDQTSPITEYSMVMRLAEQYLVRAEARAEQNKITGTNSAATDVNAIRTRAGIAGTTATTQGTMLLAIEDERLRELFTEWGHRWLDLKRTGRALTVLGALKPNLNQDRLLFPIPQNQITNDPAMAHQQNPGY